MTGRLPAWLSGRLRLPLIAAPMLRVSGPELVIAACRAGIVGAFPTANARSVTELDRWLTQIESAIAEYRDMLVGATIDDIVLTRAFTGLPTSMLRPAIEAAGLDAGRLDEQVTPGGAERMYGGGSDGPGPKRWRDIFSAGHSVSGVTAVASVAEIVGQTAAQYARAQASDSDQEA